MVSRASSCGRPRRLPVVFLAALAGVGCEQRDPEQQRLQLVQMQIRQQLEALMAQDQGNCWVLVSARVSWVARATRPGVLKDRTYGFLRHLELAAGLDLDAITLQPIPREGGRTLLTATVPSPRICATRVPSQEQQIWPAGVRAMLDASNPKDLALLQALERQHIAPELLAAYEHRLKQAVRRRARDELVWLGARAGVEVLVMFEQGGIEAPPRR